MDGGDRYRKLLTTVSHTQQQRHVALLMGSSQHLAGNVFLPAIQQRNSVQSALSMKHLEVIEQCILAENRREEQLATCSSEKERRYLTKKFIAQRERERDLLQALMLGHPTDQDLQIVDVTTSAQPSKSPLERTTKDNFGGVRVLSECPDKVIAMHGDKTFTTTTPSTKKPTKAVSPPFHGAKSPARWRAEHAKELVLPEWNSSPSKASATISPVRQRPTKSASPSCKSPPHSPSHNGTADPKLPEALANSPLRQPVRQHASDQRDKKPSPSPTKRTKRPTATTRKLGESQVKREEPMTGSSVAFNGATGFHEARQQAMTILHEAIGFVEDGTQTTDRSFSFEGSPTERVGHHGKTFDLTLPSEGSTSPSKSRHSRPLSSPEPRRHRPSAEAHLLPLLTPVHSDTGLPRVAVFQVLNDLELDAIDGVVASPPHDPVDTPHVLSNEAPFKAASDELDLHIDEQTSPRDEKLWAAARPEARVAGDQPRDEDDTRNSAASVDQDGDEEDDSLYWEALESLARAQDAAARACVEKDLAHDNENDGANHDDHGEGETTVFTGDDDDDAHVILDILYDLIHQLEEMAVWCQPTTDVAVEKMITVEPTAQKRLSSLVNVGHFATVIQSAFRGLRARRAFRLALYQQALECGVLGAMPGTQQGHSGWYQDPKSFMAYYFVVRPDGEWVQKAMLRCSALVLTPYAMREQILARVHGPLDD